MMMLAPTRKKKKAFFRIILTGTLLLFVQISLMAQNNPVPDSLLREQLTRAVQSWQEGKALIAYQTLDSISGQPLTQENASSKVKGAIWTATYLQEQKKYKPAENFLDSALTWASQYARGEELKRTYEAWSQLHLLMGNARSAIAAQTEANKINDSLVAVLYQHSLDSLTTINSKLQADVAAKNLAADEEAFQKAQSSPVNILMIIMGVAIIILLIAVSVLNRKLKAIVSIPGPYKESREQAEIKVKSSYVEPEIKPAGKVDSKITIKLPPEERVADIPDLIKKSSGKPLTETKKTATQTEVAVKEPEVKKKDTTEDVYALTAKLSTVELVLIRPDVFAWKVNGEPKVAQKLLQKYLDEFPALMKSLDDAIATNNFATIVQSLSLLKPYQEQMGMSGTLSWIEEIETEGPTAKVNKILSRVFQVRNHARRALDEANAILEKVNL